MSSDVSAPLRDGRYRLLDIIGSGGMATVYKAYDTRLGVYRAIKRLSDKYAPDFAARAWFEEEATVMARLRHRNIVTVYDIDVDLGRPFIVMDLCVGGSVMQLLDRVGRLGPGLASDIALQMLDALVTAHAADVVHRDVKPHNILFGPDDVPMLTDFGVARKPSAEWTPSTRRRILGTPTYMAPEQRANPELADGRADLYSLGLCLYVMLTGRQPFAAHEAADAVDEVAEIAPELATVVARATRSAPSDRYRSAEAMRDALAEAAADLPVTAPVLLKPGTAPARRVTPPSMPPSPETWPPLGPRHASPAASSPRPAPRADYFEEDSIDPSPRPPQRSQSPAPAEPSLDRAPLLVAGLAALMVIAMVGAGLVGAFVAANNASVASAMDFLTRAP